MSQETSRTPVETTDQVIRRVATTMLRGALWPTLVVGVAAVVVAGVVRGSDGAVGAAIGVLIALGSGAFSLSLMRWTAAAVPVTVMSAALLSFVTKFGLLLVVFLVLQGTTLFDTDALALALLAATITWTTGASFAFTRAKIPSVSPEPRGAARAADDRPTPTG